MIATLRSIALEIAVILFVGFGGTTTAQSDGPQVLERKAGALQLPTAMNLGLAVGVSVASVEIGVAAFSVSESAQGGADLNGDGDALDRVVHVLHDRKNRVTNSGLASAGTFGFQVMGERLLVVVSEAAQGGVDLNGDTDANDSVPVVRDLVTGVDTVVPVDVAWAFLSGNDLIYLPSASSVLYVYHIPTQTTVQPTLFPHYGLAVTEELIVYGVREAIVGLDLNGDGDVGAERVVFVYDRGAGTTTNLVVNAAGNSENLYVRDGFVVIGVDEALHGATDLNGDGDASDTVLHVHTAGVPGVTNLGLVANSMSFIGLDSIVFSTPENEQGLDLNGDSDLEDFVPHVYRLSTQAITNVSVASGGLIAGNDSLLAIPISEAGHGNVDLNGDGDTSDNVVHAFYVTSGQLVNLEHASNFTRPKVVLNRIFFNVSEALDGENDWNEDGDVNDQVPFVWRRNGRVRKLALAWDSWVEDSRRLIMRISEAGSNQMDLNDDGDSVDSVLFAWDATTLLPHNFEIANNAWSSPTGDSQLVFVREAEQGGVDLNGDGDANDTVVYRLRFSPPRVGTLGTLSAPRSTYKGRDADAR